MRNLKGFTYAEMRRWIKRCIDHPDTVEKKTSRQIAEEIHSRSLNHDKINKLYEDIRRKYNNFIEAGLDDEARALLDMAKMFELYKDAEYTLDKDDIDINIAAHESPAGPDISKIDPVLEGLIHDDSFIELFNKAVKKNTDVPKDKIAPLLESCVKADDISVLRYDDATLLVVSREGKPYRIVRYASNSYVDYLSAPRLDPNESHFANISDNGFKFEVLRDRPEVLADYIDDITMYYENPILRPIVEEISSGEYYNLREAVLHLRGIAYEFKGSSDEEHKKIGQHALKLLHSLMYHENKGIRVEANRVLHDIYTDRPEDFPLTKSYKTVLQGQPQTIEVACRKGETEGRIQWSINGVMQEPIKMSKSSGSTKFSAVVPVDTGTIHYAVEVKLARTWRYKVGLGNESQVSGVIKTQKDMRGKHILEVRTAIFDLAKGEDGKPVWNKDGSLSISNFDQLRKLLPELKKRYDAIWLMDCFEWGPVCYPGKDPSSFAPIDHITIAASLGGEEALDRLRQEAKSGEKKIDLIHNLIPHISQSNTTLPAYFPVYRFDGPRLVRHNSSDGQGDWDDSFQPNWRRKEVLDRYESMVMRLAKKGDSFRADVAHAFDTTFQVDNGAVGMARIFGDIVTNQRRDNGDGCFKTTDLSGTGEPNVILSRLAYEIQANAPNSLIYGENFATKTEDRGWQANDERLIKSGIVPYNSLHEELAHVLRDSRDVSGIIDHMVYRKWVHDQFGGQDVTVYASHDYQRDPQIPDEIYRDRPPLQLYGDGIIPFMATIFLLDYHGPILWHFARLLGDESDDFSKRHNLSLAEFWKIWVNNIRQFDYEGAVQASRAYLKDNPHLNALGDYAFALKNMLEKYDVMRSSDAKMVRHDSDCMSVLKSKGNEAILGFINYGYHNKDIFRPLPELSNIKDDQMYELEELFRYSKNEGFSKSPPIYLSGNELRNLGLHESLSAWETVIYSIKPVKVELYTLNILRQSMVNYKNFGVEDRVKYSLVSSLLKDSIENRDFIRFKDVLVKMINIARHTHGLEIGDVATVLYDISRYYPEYKDEITDQITGIALEDGSDQDMDIRYDAVRVLRGMQIGEVAMASVETRDIAGLGGLALYIKDIAMALVDMGLDTTIFTNIFNYNREGNKIFQSIVHNANLKYTGKSIVVPYYGESHDTISHFNRAYIYHTMLGGKVRTYALHNDRYGDVLYGGITAEDLVRRYRFFALGALEAIRTVNVHPSVLQTNEGATGFAIPYLTLPEYGYLSNDTHFSGLRVKVHANHNLDHNYQNIVTGDNQGHKRDLMRIAGLNPDNFEHHMLISADAKSREINPTYAANNRSDYSLAVSPGYRDYTANNSASLGLGDLMRSKRDNLV
ncbi:MAG: glycogen/starch synthase [Candidatus Omnitrophica bacterium]|nr:glycogen/starch synthase [Candidatus Omnitrophota bacterium]